MDDYTKPKKWAEVDIRHLARNVCYNAEACRESRWEDFIRREVKTYISQGEVIKMLMALADALGYEVRRVTNQYEAVKKGAK